MLGAEKHPYMSRNDKAMQQLAANIGCPKNLIKPMAVYILQVASPSLIRILMEKGPDRTGCNLCGMLGCRFNAKNTLDKIIYT